VQHTNDLGQPKRPHNGWVRFALRNGRAYGKDKAKFKCRQDRHKSCADKGKTHKEFEVGDHVFLKVKARHGSLKLGNCYKFATCYCGPFEILERIGLVAYMLAFPASSCIRNVTYQDVMRAEYPHIFEKKLSFVCTCVYNALRTVHK
jgi:hypothetical protein